MRWLSLLAGIAALAWGAFQFLIAYAFASMIDPDIDGPARTAEIVRVMTTGDGLNLTGNGALLIGVGLWLILSRPKPEDCIREGPSQPPRRKQRTSRRV